MDITEKQAWDNWHSEKDEQARTWLIHRYLPMVDAMVRTFRNVRRADVEDLRAAGRLGLIGAVDRWDPARLDWESFARFKIRTAAVDQIRAMSWAPKSVRTEARRLDAAAAELEAQNAGRPPSEDELARHMGVDIDELAQIRSKIGATDWSVASLDNTEAGEGSWLEALADPAAETPEEETVRAEHVATLRSVLDRLPSKLRWVLEQRYYLNRTQKSIAAEMGVHESRVSQLLDDAFARARQLAHEAPLTLTAGEMR